MMKTALKATRTQKSTLKEGEETGPGPLGDWLFCDQAKVQVYLWELDITGIMVHQHAVKLI